MFDLINILIEKIHKQRPLVLNITNEVTSQFVANGLLSLGASPVMSKAQKDACDLVPLAATVVINMGTLNDDFIDLAHVVGCTANSLKKPIIFDPVGAGATTYRTEACQKILKDHQVAILRGNASEIMALAKRKSKQTKGVDTSISSHAALGAAKELAQEHQLTVVVSGATDLVISTESEQFWHRGSKLMPRITGSGCLLSAVMGAFHGVTPLRDEAANAAILFYTVAGELAEIQAQNPGSFQVAFLDALSLKPHKKDYLAH